MNVHVQYQQMQGIKDLMIGADMSFCFKDCLGCPPCCPVLPEAFFLFIIVPYLDHYLPYIPYYLLSIYLSLTVLPTSNQQTPPANPNPPPPDHPLTFSLPHLLHSVPLLAHRHINAYSKPLHTFRLFPPHTRTLTRNAAVPQTNTGQNPQTSVPSR